jgi:hypothetical protein
VTEFFLRIAQLVHCVIRDIVSSGDSVVFQAVLCARSEEGLLSPKRLILNLLARGRGRPLAEPSLSLSGLAKARVQVALTIEPKAGLAIARPRTKETLRAG